MDTAWIALIGTLFGGAGLKLLEGGLARSKGKTDAAAQIREELRQETTKLREELRQVEKDLDQWKEKYFMLFQEYLEIKSQVAHQNKEPTEKEDDW